MRAWPAGSTPVRRSLTQGDVEVRWVRDSRLRTDGRRANAPPATAAMTNTFIPVSPRRGSPWIRRSASIVVAKSAPSKGFVSGNAPDRCADLPDRRLKSNVLRTGPAFRCNPRPNGVFEALASPLPLWRMAQSAMAGPDGRLRTWPSSRGNAPRAPGPSPRCTRLFRVETEESMPSTLDPRLLETRRSTHCRSRFPDRFRAGASRELDGGVTRYVAGTA